MPIEDIPVLNDEQIARIKNIVYNTKGMRDRNEDVSTLLSEANLDFAQMMNKLVFDDSLKKRPTPSQEFTVNLVQPLSVDTKKPEVPWYFSGFLIYFC